MSLYAIDKEPTASTMNEIFSPKGSETNMILETGQNLVLQKILRMLDISIDV